MYKNVQECIRIKKEKWFCEDMQPASYKCYIVWYFNDKLISSMYINAFDKLK